MRTLRGTSSPCQLIPPALKEIAPLVTPPAPSARAEDLRVCSPIGLGAPTLLGPPPFHDL